MKTAAMTIAAQRRWPLASLLSLIMIGLMLQSAPAHAMAPKASAAGRAVVLQTFRVGQFALDLAIATCRRSECPIEVRLRSGGRIVDRITLPVAASSQRATAETTDIPWGADAGRKAWATGQENSSVSTAARLLRLAPQTSALLVTQLYGFEHPKRNHLLIVPRVGKLDIVWKAEEGSGPTWSATQIIGDPKGTRHEILYLNGFSEPEEDAADSLDAVRLRWDDASSRLRETALPARDSPLYLLNLGIHETIAQAREARSANSYCLSAHWILDASRFRAGASRQAIIGSLYATRASAEAAAGAAKSCLPDVTASVETWTAAP